MIRKINVIIVTLMFCLTTIVIVPDNIIKATEPEMDSEYIESVTGALSNVIFDVNWSNNLEKGRAFGTKGELFAANYLAEEMNNNLSLYDPTSNLTSSHLEQIDDLLFGTYLTDKHLTHKLDTLSLGLSVKNDSNVTNVVDFYITPRWTYEDNCTNISPPDNKSELTGNFTYTNLSILRTPNNLSSAIDDCIQEKFGDIIEYIIDKLIGNKSIDNFLEALGNFIMKQLENKYNFTFEEIDPDNESTIPNFLKPITNYSDNGFVYIEEETDFNPNYTLPYQTHINSGLVSPLSIAVWGTRWKMKTTHMELIRKGNPNCRGVIRYDFNNYTYNMELGEYPLPIIFINGTLGKKINASFENYTIDFNINQNYNKSVESYNVIGQINGTDSSKTVVISSLYDCWWNQGTADSAIGMAIVMGIAKFMKELETEYNIMPKYDVKFVAFAGEEYKIRGSEYFEYAHRNEENITYVIDLNQLGFDQKNPELRTALNLVTNYYYPQYVLKEIGERTNYGERTGDVSDFKTASLPGGALSNDRSFTRVYHPLTYSIKRYMTIGFLEDMNWTRHHRDGRANDTAGRHTGGDVIEYYNSTDVNVTSEMVWNVTKYFTYNPDCWFEGDPLFYLYDTNNDEIKDTINVSYSLNKSWPLSEPVSVRMVLYPKYRRKHPCWPLLYRLREQKDYVLTSNVTDGYMNVTIPTCFPKGEYIAELYLCNSTGDIFLDSINTLGLETVIDGVELSQLIWRVLRINIGEKFGLNKKTILQRIGIDVVDWIEKLWNLKSKIIRNLAIDFFGYDIISTDKTSSTFTLHPPNNPPETPGAPDDLGPGEFGIFNWYRTNSTDPDGDKMRFQWNWNGITGFPSIWKYNSNQDHLKQHRWWKEGEKTVKVRACDPWNPTLYSDWSVATDVTVNDYGYFDIYTSQTNQININNPNSVNSFDNKVVVAGQSTDYQGLYCGFPEAPICDYDFDGVENQSGPDCNYTFTETGDKYVNFTANYSGEIVYYNILVRVVNIKPCFNMNKLGAQPNQTINFTDTTLSKNSIVNWTWDFGDGNISYDQNVSHNFSAVGIYNVTLNVTDDNNESAVFWQIVHIETNPPDIIDATYYPIPGTLGCNMTLCAGFFDNNGSGINTVTVNISYPNGTANNFTMEEDENNSYGYKYVFNDTMQVGWYFFDIWVSDYANNSNNFPGCGFQIQPAFGYSIIGNQSKNIDDNISGSNFTVPANGTAESISAYIHANLSTPPETKCMIYRVNDSVLIGTTEEKAINTGDEPDWVTYNFTSKPNLTTNTQYILACWSNDTCNLSYNNASDDSYGKYLYHTYGNPPPSIINGTNEARLYSIFCNYSTIPFIKNSSASPDPIGFGYNNTITAEVEHYFTLVENITVNITYPNSTYVNYSMNRVDDDTYQCTTDILWKVGQYNYTIWVKDKLGGNSTNTGYSFNVSAQATISVCTIIDDYGDNETVNLTDPPGEPPLIGYELLDDGEVLHIWNKYDSYYFDTDSGIQLTNHYNEYWSHNVLMLGYYNNDQWNLMYRTDELSGFNKDIDTDNETFVNVTMWKNLEYYGYDFRLAIRYYLGVDDNELTVIPYIKNIDQSDIPYVLGFGWEMKDIQIDMTTAGDYIDVNGTMYYLNQTLNNTYTDLSESEFYLMENITDTSTKSLYLKWNQSLTYKLRVKSREGQCNAPVTLFVRIGTLASGQEKHTKMYWYDADQITYYFNSYDNGEAWATNPSYMVDGNGNNYASTTTDGDIELCDGNNCSGSDIGEISIVELRICAYYSGGSRNIFIRPVFGGTTDGLNIQYSPSNSAGVWSPWYEITRDPFAPATWTWADVQNLDCDIELVDGMGPPCTMYCSQVEIRVTYDAYDHPEITNPVPADGSNGISLTPTLNITVSDGDGDLMNITWLSNSSGSWQVFDTNISVGNGTYHQIFDNATENGKWWYWKVNVTDGYNYTVSSVYKFYTGYQSKINNTGTTNIKGYLLVQVQYYNETSENWTVVDDTVNETTARSILWADPFGADGQNIFALDTIFNGLVNTSNISEYGNGTYRIYAALRDPDGDVLICNDETEIEATYEFTITFD